MSTANPTTRAEVDASVRDVLQTALERPVPPGAPVSRANEARWDSVRHIEILFMLEDALGITFDEAELGALDSVDAIVERAAAHLGV